MCDTIDLCVICQNTEITNQIYILPCNHKFHSTCINSWSHYKDECPICKKRFNVEQTQPVVQSNNVTRSNNVARSSNATNVTINVDPADYIPLFEL